MAPSQIQNGATFLRNSASGSSSEELCPPSPPPAPAPSPASIHKAAKALWDAQDS